MFRLSIYALGDILGAGIYALVGKVAAFAGNLVWLSFLMAGACAVPTALCYAELSSRFPRAGGATVFIHHAFGGKTFPRIVGFMVLASGMISSATIANAFAGYFGQLLPVSREVIIIGFILFLSLINFVGINQSALLYGMSNEGWLHRVFSFVHQGRGTPLVAIGVVFVISVTIALIGRLTGLARLANANILAIFFFVNLALIIIHRRGGVPPSFCVPRWLPYAGAVLSLVFLAKNIGVI